MRRTRTWTAYDSAALRECTRQVGLHREQPEPDRALGEPLPRRSRRGPSDRPPGRPQSRGPRADADSRSRSSATRRGKPVLITFAKHGQGSAAAAADELLADRDRVGKERTEVTVLRGDPPRVAQVASLDFEHRDRSAVIAGAAVNGPTNDQDQRGARPLRTRLQVRSRTGPLLLTPGDFAAIPFLDALVATRHRLVDAEICDVSVDGAELRPGRTSARDRRFRPLRLPAFGPTRFSGRLRRQSAGTPAHPVCSQDRGRRRIECRTTYARTKNGPASRRDWRGRSAGATLALQPTSPPEWSVAAVDGTDAMHKLRVCPRDCPRTRKKRLSNDRGRWRRLNGVCDDDPTLVQAGLNWRRPRAAGPTHFPCLSLESENGDSADATLASHLLNVGRATRREGLRGRNEPLRESNLPMA